MKLISVTSDFFLSRNKTLKFSILDSKNIPKRNGRMLRGLDTVAFAHLDAAEEQKKFNERRREAESLSRAPFCARVIAALQLPFNYECRQ